MPAVGGRYVVVFNGEIYNYKSLVPLLKKAGYVFNENSDTAVLAPLYDMDGPAMLERLEGMFALAIWDTQEQTLFVARDHAGIKPLYYAETPNGLAFASELKALLALPDVSRTLDATAMAEYLSFLWTPGARTMLAGVKKLRPGHYMMIKKRKRGVSMNMVRWYQPPQAPLGGGFPIYDATRTPAALLELLDTVVAEQCTSDVPVGAFLSGGVDSSAIVASMVATGHAPAQTYCVGFAGEGFRSEGFSDDLAFAQDVAQKLGVPLKPLMVDMPALLQRLPGLSWMLDEPTADPAPLFVADIARQARADGVTVLLSGTGGDDVFSGYRRHQAARIRQWLGGLGRGVGGLMGAVAPWVSGAVGRRATRLADLLGSSDEDFLLRAFTTNSIPNASGLLRKDVRDTVGNFWPNALTQARSESMGQDLLNRLLYMELFGFLPDHNLNYTDKAAMTFGIEGRVPLIDRRIMAYMAEVSPALKMRGLDAKSFFKQAVGARLPSGVLTRSKAGFGAPIRQWLRTGEGQRMMESALFDSAFSREWLDEKAVQMLWARTCAGTVDGIYTALAIAMMAWWIDGMTSR